MRTWTFTERRPAGKGPWGSEPDKAQWIDAATGLDCLIVRNHMGALCGYVGVPPGHPLHGRGFEDVHAQVHGDLTYAGPCQEGAEDGPGVCHVPEEGRPAHVWWLGFDCAHGGDLVPSLQHIYAEVAAKYPRTEVYRDFGYVKAEVEALAAQLAEQAQG